MNPQPNPKYNKKVAIMLSLTIPATGKSTAFNQIKHNIKNHNIIIISSDAIKQRKVLQLVPNYKEISKKQAGYLVKKQADAEYYKQIQEVLKRIDKGEEQKEKYQHDSTVLFLDKNYSQITLSPAIQQLRQIISKYKNLSIKIMGILPKCNRLFKISSGINQYSYPFSICFFVCCLKRILTRDQHPTLQGTKNYRSSVCLGWANNFRNFALTDQHINKIFDGIILFPFTKQQPVPMAIQSKIVTILRDMQYGSFDQHVEVGELVGLLEGWNGYVQSSPLENLEYYQEILDDLFACFNSNMDKYRISQVLKANHIAI